MCRAVSRFLEAKAIILDSARILLPGGQVGDSQPGKGLCPPSSDMAFRYKVLAKHFYLFGQFFEFLQPGCFLGRGMQVYFTEGQCGSLCLALKSTVLSF